MFPFFALNRTKPAFTAPAFRFHNRFLMLACIALTVNVSAIANNSFAGLGTGHYGYFVEIIDNDDVQKEVDELIDQLGSNEFAEREYAAKRLVEIGMPCVDKLRDLKSAADSEVQFAASRIVKKIVRSDFENRIEAFLAASDDDAADFGLPGWEVYSQQVGSSKNARELFASMQRLHPRLMKSLEGDIKSVNSELRDLMGDLVSNANRYNDTPIESFAACFMLATADKINGKQVELPHNSDNNLSSLFRNQVVANQLQEGKYNEILKTFVVRWIQQDSPNVSQEYYRLMIADTHQLKEAVPLALNMINNRESTHYYRQYAIWYLVKTTGTEHQKEIEKLLDDKNNLRETKKLINGVDVEFEIQMRDVALAALVYMYKQPYEDFGFEMAPANMTTPLSYSQSGFRDDKSRLKAIKKWEAFKQNEDIK